MFVTNQHEQYWQESLKSSIGPKHARIKKLCAAFLGHYRALSVIASTDPEQFHRLKIALLFQQRMQYFRQLAESASSAQVVSDLKDQIDAANDAVIAYIEQHGSLPSRLELKEMMLLETNHLPWWPRFKQYALATVFFINRWVLGRNNFLTQPVKRCRDFDVDMYQAERGLGVGNKFSSDTVRSSLPALAWQHTGAIDKQIAFSEHKFYTPKQAVLEALCMRCSRISSPDRPANVVIYLGGTGDYFARMFRYICSLFYALPDCDALWYVNPSHMSLSSGSGVVPHDAILHADLQLVYACIRKQHPTANITVVALCASAPASAKFCQAHGVKFFSDRSFLDINEVASGHVYRHLRNFPLVLQVVYVLLLPLRWLRRKFVNLSGFTASQYRDFSKMPAYLRQLHVVQVPKSDPKAAKDSIHEETGVSLHTVLDAEEKAFDDAFSRICDRLSSHAMPVVPKQQQIMGIDKYLARLIRYVFGSMAEHILPGIKQKTGYKAHKRARYRNMAACTHTDNDVNALLYDLMMWHKDRKSYIPTTSKQAFDSKGCKKDPHQQWSHGLTSRGLHCNPFWRLNAFVACDKNALSQPLDGFSGVSWHPDVQVCIDQAKPLFVQMVKDARYKQALRKLNDALNCLSSSQSSHDAPVASSTLLDASVFPKTTDQSLQKPDRLKSLFPRSQNKKNPRESAYLLTRR